MPNPQEKYQVYKTGETPKEAAKRQCEYFQQIITARENLIHHLTNSNEELIAYFVNDFIEYNYTSFLKTDLSDFDLSLLVSRVTFRDGVTKFRVSVNSKVKGYDNKLFRLKKYYNKSEIPLVIETFINTEVKTTVLQQSN